MTYDCEPEFISITSGTIDEASVRGHLPKPKRHIFVGGEKKAGWYELPEDGLPKYEKFSNGFQKKLDEWRTIMNAPGLG